MPVKIIFGYREWKKDIGGFSWKFGFRDKSRNQVRR
jgi:hypothetical protein